MRSSRHNVSISTTDLDASQLLICRVHGQAEETGLWEVKDGFWEECRQFGSNADCETVPVNLRMDRDAGGLQAYETGRTCTRNLVVFLTRYFAVTPRTFTLSQSVMILRAVGDIVSSMSLYSLGAPLLAS